MKDKMKMRDTATERIAEVVQFANLAGVNAADMGISLSIALFRNIRDVMFHFRAMCDCLEDDGYNSRDIHRKCIFGLESKFV